MCHADLLNVKEAHFYLILVPAFSFSYWKSTSPLPFSVISFLLFVVLTAQLNTDISTLQALGEQEKIALIDFYKWKKYL